LQEQSKGPEGDQWLFTLEEQLKNKSAQYEAQQLLSPTAQQMQIQYIDENNQEINCSEMKESL
jgi:hypothetical protein